MHTPHRPLSSHWAFPKGIGNCGGRKYGILAFLLPTGLLCFAFWLFDLFFHLQHFYLYNFPQNLSWIVLPCSRFFKKKAILLIFLIYFAKHMCAADFPLQVLDWINLFCLNLFWGLKVFLLVNFLSHPAFYLFQNLWIQWSNCFVLRQGLIKYPEWPGTP